MGNIAGPAVQVKDLDLLHDLMTRQGVSARRLGRAAGWSSPTSANRLLAGEVKKLTPDRAAAIARLLNVAPRLLFVPVVSTDPVRIVS